MGLKNAVELEELARLGKWQSIERAVLVNSKKKLNVSEAIHLAKLARRAYRLQLTLKILKDYVVKPDGEFDMKAEPEALVEYAICLTMLGARNSALKILNQHKYSSASLHFAWITHYFSTYQYSSAIPHVEKFIELQEDEYMKNVGRLNLCACKVTLALDDNLEKELEVLKNTFKKNGHSVLFANASELSAQYFIRNKKWN